MWQSLPLRCCILVCLRGERSGRGSVRVGVPVSTFHIENKAAIGIRDREFKSMKSHLELKLVRLPLRSLFRDVHRAGIHVYTTVTVTIAS